MECQSKCESISWLDFYGCLLDHRRESGGPPKDSSYSGTSSLLLLRLLRLLRLLHLMWKLCIISVEDVPLFWGRPTRRKSSERKHPSSISLPVLCSGRPLPLQRCQIISIPSIKCRPFIAHRPFPNWFH